MISSDEYNKRKAAIHRALAISSAADTSVSDEIIKLSETWANGELSLEEVQKIIIAKYNENNSR